MLATVILSTYNRPEVLELAIHAYAAQSCRDFELIVADDGSTPETAHACRRAAQQSGLPVRRVWHEDRGFRKCRILNQAVLESRGDYLIFSDGDCLPRRDFVATHLRLARPGRFLSGGRVGLPAGAELRLTPSDAQAGLFADPSWIADLGLGRITARRRLRLAARPAALADRLTTTRPTWNGHNASGWREDVLRVNGYDERMGYGGLDREMGERLVNAGVRPVQVRHRAVCVHVEHERDYLDAEVVAANRRIRDGVRLRRLAWTDHGLYRRSLLPFTPMVDEPQSPAAAPVRHAA